MLNMPRPIGLFIITLVLCASTSTWFYLNATYSSETAKFHVGRLAAGNLCNLRWVGGKQMLIRQRAGENTFARPLVRLHRSGSIYLLRGWKAHPNIHYIMIICRRRRANMTRQLGIIIWNWDIGRCCPMMVPRSRARQRRNIWCNVNDLGYFANT